MAWSNGEFIVGEWYHCYNRSIDKRIAFTDIEDYQRFLELLYLANDETPLRRADLGVLPFESVLKMPRGKRLVSIAAFCLMPAHFHVVLRETTPGGITAFMRKLGTAYSLYFNARHKRQGNLFLKPFRSLPVPEERSLPSVIHYVHCNPAALYEPEWKKNHVVDPQFLGERLAAYPYSSLKTLMGAQGPHRAILDLGAGPAASAPIQKMLKEARTYCAQTDLP